MNNFLSIFQNEIFIQAIGFVGIAVSIYGMQQKSYQRFMLFRILNELIFGFQFLLLGAYTGMATNFAACVTNSVYSARIKRGKSTLPFQIMFSILFVGLGILTWQGPVSILVILAKLLSTVSFGINNTKIIRIINLISTPMWIIYDVVVFSIAAIVSDLFLLISVIVAVVRLDILKINDHPSKKGEKA